MTCNQPSTCYSRHLTMQEHSSTCTRQVRTPRSLWNCQDNFPTILVAILLQRHRAIHQDMPRMPDPCDEQASHPYHDCSTRRPFRSSRRTETQTSHCTHCFSIHL